MASTKKAVPSLVSGGMDRSQVRHLVKDQGLWTLLNWKPDRGRLVETPRLDADFSLVSIFSQAASPVRFARLVRNVAGALRYLIVDQKTARFVDPTATATQVGLPVIVQSAVPNLTTVNGECLLWGFNTTDFAADGDTIEVKNDTATTFMWRRNALAWSASLPVASETLLNVNGLRVGFQVTTGFVIGSTWKWTRSSTHPYTGADATTFNLPQYPSAVYNTDVYIAGLERNVMRVRDNLFTTTGYRRIYGKYVAVFMNHLIVGQYAPGVYDVTVGVKDSYNAQKTPNTVAWSHLNNPDQMFSTDLNEADSYPIPEQAQSDWAVLGISGMEVWNNVLYIFLADAIYVMQYVGLPTVMRTEQINGTVGSVFQRGLVRGATGLYFIGRNGIYVLRTSSPENIGVPIFDTFRAEWLQPADSKFQQLFGFYNADAQEVCWVYWYLQGAYYCTKMICYQEMTGQWYTRTIGNAQVGAGCDVWTVWQRYNDYQSLCYGGNNSSNSIYKDLNGVPSLSTTEEKNGATSVFTQPTVETAWAFYGDVYSQKEVDTMSIDSVWSGGDGSFELYCACKTGSLSDGDANPGYSLADTLTLAKLERRLSLPRSPFRFVTFKFVLKNSNVRAVLPWGGVFNGYQPNIYIANSE